MSDNPSKSWFVIWDYPESINIYKTDSAGGFVLDSHNDKIIEKKMPSELAGLTPEEMCNKVLDMWCGDSPTKTGACAYCVTAKGMPHLHMVLEDAQPHRFSAVKKIFPRPHLVPTRGNKQQAENYILKLGSWAEKGEQVVCTVFRGEIKGRQGQRNDLDEIAKLLDEGAHPNDILLKSFKNEKYDKMIQAHYLRKRISETPFLRDIDVYWHVGPSGCGKTYIAVDLYNKNRNNFYFVTDYRNGFMDKYCGEKILFLDEFRGQIPYSTLLTMLQGYLGQIHSRYSNVYGLWSEVHITSVFSPEMIYKKMVEIFDRDIDTFDQLKRRITGIYYHWKDEKNDTMKNYYVPFENYICYSKLVCDAMGDVDKGFAQLSKEDEEFVQMMFG